MRQRPRIYTGARFMIGDYACAEGALAAGCTFFAGYPITPATETAERMAERLPEVGGIYIQMEDEIASVTAILGAAWAGAKTMTATSGPGFSLMMETVGLAVITETPCVIVNVQRAAPSTGLPTLVAQGDMMQAKWGSHGSYEIIALCPASPQECFDLTVRAFNLSEQYRIPVFIMTDAEVGHMAERVMIPEADKVKLVDRKRPTCAKAEFRTCQPDDDLVPPMPSAGEGYKVFVESLTHDERGYPVLTADVHDRLVRRLRDKILLHKADIVQFEERDLDGADVVVFAYGITARISARAIQLAREEGIQVGLLRPITIWPFGEERVRELAGRIKAFVVPELNLGQMALEVERATAGRCAVLPVCHAGGDVHDPDEILAAIRRAAQ